MFTFQTHTVTDRRLELRDYREAAAKVQVANENHNDTVKTPGTETSSYDPVVDS